MAVLKPFVINLNDLAFLLKQVNFIPLFDAQGNAVINWNGSTPVYDTHNNLLSDGSGNAAANIQALGRLDPITNTYVAGFPDVSAPIGVRDVTGFHNNLFGTQAEWGAVDVPFVRQIPADYSNYVTNDGNGGTADYSVIGGSVTDMMPRIISRTITTAGVNLLQDSAGVLGQAGALIEWDPSKYTGGANENTNYVALINGAGVDVAQLVEGAKIVAPAGLSLAWDPALDSASMQYGTLLAFVAALGSGDQLYGPGGAPLQDGVAVHYKIGPTYVPVGINFDANLAIYHSLVVESGVNTAGLAAGDPILITATDITDAIASVATSYGGTVAQATADALVTQESGYGLLETLGHIDFQNPDSGEYFIGSENPGVAPVNSWFGIFGQFFDHGLDFIGKGGNGTITIALDPSDPLYNEAPNHAITISRASVFDANGDAAYVNNTSPFIDQSQTYGSVDQITNILREWVSTDGGSTFHAGMKLFDGTTLVDSWTRKWPDGTTQEVHDTLPTLNELRAHLIATGRDDLSWEDVSNLRNRDAVTGDVITSGPGAGNSGHALLLDMNPGFTSGTFNASTLSTAKVAGAVQLLKTHVQADNSIGDADGIADFGISDGSILGTSAGDLYITTSATVMGVPAGTYTGATALMLSGWIDHNFNIVAADPAVHAAVGEILMASVGAHYIAGDGRVNENFGLTSIHHVFHEEHNFQVENLKTWIYAHDLNNPGATDTHEQLHNWQDATSTLDGNGNYIIVAAGDIHGTAAIGDIELFDAAHASVGFAAAGDTNIAWNADKMFEATKLVVEMEYQHAAVDQYARTVTPRIQEFVGYSSGVDSTISLEYAQVAFRFGHSTIRETIDAIDPSGWMLGHVTRYALEKAFLNPQQFADTGVAAITLGLSRQQMNEVDEFVTPALNQGLLGQPLDLPAINIARGRDLGIPTLNDFRAGIGLAEYTSWTDFGAGMYHPESLVNFIAAYSFGGDLAKAEAIMGLADGSITTTTAFGTESVTAADAVAFMNNNYTGDNTELGAGQMGFDQIDSWIGGLAEAHVPGGLLGETFDAVFVAQIQSLMDGDRFYYLYRLFGTQIHEEVNNGQFKDIVERNTGLTHLNGSIFAYADKYYDFNRDALPADSELHNLANTITYYTDKNGQLYGTRTGAGTAGDPFVYSDKIDASNPLPAGDTALFIGTTPVTGFAGHGYGTLLATAGNTKGIYSDGGSSLAPNGSDISVTASDGVRDNVTLSLIRDVRPDLQPDLVHPVEGTPTDGADSHEVIVATANADYIHARGGDDTVYGEEGDDYIYGDGGVDRLYGGDGDDMIDTGEGPDLADGGAGKDIIYGRGSGSEVGGFDQLVGGSGNDLIVGGEGIDKLSGGSGDDIIYGDGLTNPEMGNTDPFTHAGDGNDYIDGGASGDLLFGEEGDDYIVGGNDQDLMQGGQGDDIIRPGNPSQASGTTGGPDEVVGDDGQANAGFDLIDFSDYAGNAPGVTVDFATQNNPLVNIDQTTTFPAWFQVEGAIGSRNGDTFIGDSAGDATADNSQGNNWLIGGSGNDTFTGNGGNDLIVGGSIRLDALIGKYTDAMASTNLALGSAAWLAEAMSTGGTTAGYGNDTENAYTGASNRAEGDISGGLLAGVNATIGGTANDYDLHFTEMLRSKMFRDLVLGDGDTAGNATQDTGTDTAVFTGNFAKYSMVAYDVNGTVVTDPHANWSSVFAIRVTDNRVAADFLDAGGNPLLDANGNPLVSDGSDLIVGVENFKFADGTYSAGAYFDAAPVVDLDYLAVAGPPVNVATHNISGGYAGGTGWAGAWTEAGDGANASNNGAIQITQSGGGNPNQRLEFHSSSTATISRAVNLSGLTAADNPELRFDLQRNGIGSGETLQVQYSSNGTSWTTLATYGNSGSTGIKTIDLSGQTLTANSAIRFVSGTYNSNNDYFRIDDVTIRKGGPAIDGHNGVNLTTSYTEGGTARAIGATTGGAAPRITDPDVVDTTIASAKIVLQNAITGDVLRVGGSLAASGTLATGIAWTVDSSVAGKITVTLTGGATHDNYEAALQAIAFSNTGDDPTAHGTNTARLIDVTVNDGFRDSAVATTTVNVTGVDDPATALANDTVVTNIGTGTGNAQNIAIPVWALGANDADADGVVISSIGNANGLSTIGNGLGLTGGNVVVRDGTPAGGSFTYSSGAIPSATVTVVQDTNGSLDGGTGVNTNRNDIIIGNGADTTINANGGNDIVLAGDGADTVNGGSGNDTLYGGTGDDTVNAGDGDDTIVWTAANGGGGGGNTTDGTDVVDGGTSTAGIGDRFVLNGNNQAETFRILAITDPNNGAEIDALLNAANGGQGYTLNPASTILITRTTQGGGGGGAQTTIVAELRNLEEITINTQAVTTGGGNTSGQGADTVQIVGDFTGTGLALNTITINDDQGGATVDISGLSSEHRIVFNTDANGQVVGEARPQDIVNHSGSSTGGGQTTGGQTGKGEHAPPASGGTASVTNHSSENEDEHENETEHAASQSHASTKAPSGETGMGNGEHGGVTANGASAAIVGTSSGDAISAGEQKVVSTGDGDDVVTTGDGAVVHSGAGDDIVTTGDGRNVVLAGSGDDVVTTGAGNDKVFGEAGNDLIDSGSGDDMVWGGNGDDEIHAGDGNDRIESGAGADLIYTGAGSDVIVYRNIADADGDTIADLAPGDRIDLSFIDANASADGNNAFHFGTGAMFTGAGELIVAYDAANDLTSISGNTDANTATAEFQIVLQGDHVDQLKHGGVGL